MGEFLDNILPEQTPEQEVDLLLVDLVPTPEISLVTGRLLEDVRARRKLFGNDYYKEYSDGV